MLSNTETKCLIFVCGQIFLQQEYIIIQQIKCKNQHRDKIGVQFKVYILITTLQYFFYLLRKNKQHADGHISDLLNSVYNLSERVKTEKNL